MDSAEDILLIHTLRDDRQAALKELHDRYSGVLYLYAYRIVKKREIAEEIVQDTFVRFYNSNARFTRMGSVLVYLFTSTRNFAFRHLRSEKMRARSLENNNPDTVPDDSAAKYVDAEMTRLLWTEVKTLPTSYREVVELILTDNLDTGAIAQRLNISPEAVRQRKSRAIAHLKVEFLKKKILGSIL